MKTPWTYIKEKKGLETELEEKKEELEELREEKESFRERFEAEKKRRSKLSTEKQEAEKKLNKLKQRLQNKDKKRKEEHEDETEAYELQISFKEVKKDLEKIKSIKSDEEDLITIYKSGEDFKDVKALKNSVSNKVFKEIKSGKDFAIFTDEGFFNWMLETRPFFRTSWNRGEKFDTSKLLDFIREEKYWILASMGETKIFREAAGSFEEVERVKTRVNRKQKKGGFSQGRFERKRDEQIRDHVKKVNEKLDDLNKEEIYVLGDRRLCQDIEASYLGGFDASKPVSADLFYNFELRFLI